MRRTCLGFVLAAALLLAGCGSPFAVTNVEELLRAPQATGELSAVQKALNSYLGETMQLKYPRGGEEMSPILFADFDGDGANEAAALYVVESKGQNVHLAMMEKGAADAGWEVTYEIEGLSTEIAALQLVTLVPGGIQLIIGYANATLTDKYLTVYDYHADTVTRLYEQGYTYYLADDFDAQGVSDLAVVSNTAEAGALTLQWFADDGIGGLQTVQTLSLDERFVSCQKLYVAVSGEERGLVAEGAFASGWLADEVLRLLPEHRLVRWPQNATDVPLASLRSLVGLRASVLNNDTVLRVPTSVTGVTTLSYSRRFYFVTWQDYLEQPQPQTDGEDTGVVQPELTAEVPAVTEPNAPCFGVYDASYGYFLQLPEEWRGAITIVDGNARGDWQVRRKNGNTLLLSVRVTRSDRPTGTYVRAAEIGENSVLLSMGNQCTPSESKLIRAGVTVLE